MAPAPIRFDSPSAPARRTLKGSVFSSPWAVGTFGPFAKPRSSSAQRSECSRRTPAGTLKGRKFPSEGSVFFFPMGPETSETSGGAAHEQRAAQRLQTANARPTGPPSGARSSACPGPDPGSRLNGPVALPPEPRLALAPGAIPGSASPLAVGGGARYLPILIRNRKRHADPKGAAESPCPEEKV